MKALRVAQEVMHMTLMEALDHIAANGLRSRVVASNGHAAMVTADVRMDRIGLRVIDNVVVSTELG
jgi:hypothetical protein